MMLSLSSEQVQVGPEKRTGNLMLLHAKGALSLREAGSCISENKWKIPDDHLPDYSANCIRDQPQIWFLLYSLLLLPPSHTNSNCYTTASLLIGTSISTPNKSRGME